VLEVFLVLLLLEELGLLVRGEQEIAEHLREFLQLDDWLADLVLCLCFADIDLDVHLCFQCPVTWQFPTYLKLFFEFLLSLLFLLSLVSLLSELVEIFNVIQISAGKHCLLGVFDFMELRVGVHLSVFHRGRDLVTALLPCRLLLQSVLSHLELHRHIAVLLLRFLLAILLQLREGQLARLQLDWFGRGQSSFVLLWRTLLSLLPFRELLGRLLASLKLVICPLLIGRCLILCVAVTLRPLL